MRRPLLHARALAVAFWLLLLINGTGLAALVLFPPGPVL